MYGCPLSVLGSPWQCRGGTESPKEPLAPLEMEGQLVCLGAERLPVHAHVCVHMWIRALELRTHTSAGREAQSTAPSSALCVAGRTLQHEPGIHGEEKTMFCSLLLGPETCLYDGSWETPS